MVHLYSHVACTTVTDDVICLINNIIPNRPWVFTNVEPLMRLMTWWSGSRETRCINTK